MIGGLRAGAGSEFELPQPLFASSTFNAQMSASVNLCDKIVLQEIHMYIAFAHK
jgi:hypothetical protein